MIDLYICEDNLNQLNTIQRYVENAMLIDEMDMRLVLSSRDPHTQKGCLSKEWWSGKLTDF